MTRAVLVWCKVWLVWRKRPAGQRFGFLLCTTILTPRSTVKGVRFLQPGLFPIFYMCSLTLRAASFSFFNLSHLALPLLFTLFIASSNPDRVDVIWNHKRQDAISWRIAQSGESSPFTRTPNSLSSYPT